MQALEKQGVAGPQAFARLVGSRAHAIAALWPSGRNTDMAREMGQQKVETAPIIDLAPAQDKKLPLPRGKDTVKSALPERSKRNEGRRLLGNFLAKTKQMVMGFVEFRPETTNFFLSRRIQFALKINEKKLILNFGEGKIEVERYLKDDDIYIMFKFSSKIGAQRINVLKWQKDNFDFQKY